MTSSLSCLLASAVDEALDGTDRVAVETSNRVGPGILQVLVGRARPEAGRDVRAFSAATHGVPSLLSAGWDVRQMHTEVLLREPVSNREQSHRGGPRPATASQSIHAVNPHVSVHADLLGLVSGYGFDVFLCGDLPGSDTFAAQVAALGAAMGIEVRFPFLSPGVVAALNELPVGHRNPALSAAAGLLLPGQVLTAVACHATSWPGN